MAKLTELQKVFVVQRLACLYQPREVQAQLKQVYGVEISLPAVMYYDPNTAEGARLSASLKQIFTDTRARFLEDYSSIPIANRSYRLRKLQDIVDRLGERQPKLVKELLEQAAKEVGGALTNRRELTGKGGGPIETKGTLDLSLLSDEELEALERLTAKADPDSGGDPE